MAILSSSASASASATVAVSSWWLKDPTTPARNINVYPSMPVKKTKPEVQATFRPIGRTRELIVSDTILGETLTLDIWFTTAAARTAFELLRNSQRVLLLQSSGIEQWYGRIGADRTETILATPDLSWRSANFQFKETDAI